MARHDGRVTMPNVAAFAAPFADGTRARFCLAMLDGRPWTVPELAGQAGVAASTATEHLHRLVDGGILTEQRQGRHRYVRLRDAEIAALIEALAQAAPRAHTCAHVWIGLSDASTLAARSAPRCAHMPACRDGSHLWAPVGPWH
jgi:DNA-binding transcriptional ArsR family regulator